MNMNYLQIAGIAFIWLVLVFLILSFKSNKSKNKFQSYLPHNKQTLLDNLANDPTVQAQLVNLTTANGSDDSVDSLLKEFSKSFIYAIILLVVAAIFRNSISVLCVCGAALMLVSPFLTRAQKKKSFKKKYIADFYEFLNYITLYLSAGIEFKQALAEVDKLIPSTSLLKPKIKEIRTRNIISGLSGDSYIQTLELLNQDLGFSEINSFISSARRSQERGDAISDTLLIQMTDISKKMQIEKRDYIASKENTFGAMKVGLCFIPYLLITVIPIFWAVLQVLSSGISY